ncbi:hypothetical protein [Streptomyces sp. NPDC056154]|uniref:hypothetical protein n=1 Tax=unclassified Streptomyces TaxID=2593676 RepID=UPI0035DB50B5
MTDQRLARLLDAITHSGPGYDTTLTETATPMTDRIPLDNLTSDALDQLYARAEKAERAVDHLVDRYRGAEAAIERARKLLAVWEGAPDPLARAMACDLRTTITGRTEQQPTT